VILLQQYSQYCQEENRNDPTDTALQRALKDLRLQGRPDRVEDMLEETILMLLQRTEPSTPEAQPELFVDPQPEVPLTRNMPSVILGQLDPRLQGAELHLCSKDDTPVSEEG
jgi:hypothetical protein